MSGLVILLGVAACGNSDGNSSSKDSGVPDAAIDHGIDVVDAGGDVPPTCDDQGGAAFQLTTDPATDEDGDFLLAADGTLYFAFMSERSGNMNIWMTSSKNALDWASRPPRGAALGGKPVGIIGASPGMTGSARGQSQLRQAFEFTNSFCMPQPEILVYRAHEKFDASGALTDATTAKYLAAYLAALANWVRKFR